MFLLEFSHRFGLRSSFVHVTIRDTAWHKTSHCNARAETNGVRHARLLSDEQFGTPCLPPPLPSRTHTHCCSLYTGKGTIEVSGDPANTHCFLPPQKAAVLTVKCNKNNRQSVVVQFYSDIQFNVVEKFKHLGETLTKAIEQGSSSKVDHVLASQEISFAPFMEHEGSLPCSQNTAIFFPSPETDKSSLHSTFLFLGYSL